MTGTVYKSTGSWYLVKTDSEFSEGTFYECRIKGKFRMQGIKSTNPLAVGDRVLFDLEKANEDSAGKLGVIKKILKRDNYIIRKSVNLSKQTHIIAANIDTVFLVITLNNPPTFTTFIDRFLVTAEAYHIKAVLLFNKIDTYSEDELNEVKYLAHIYRKIGYTCIGISALTGKNMDQVKSLMIGKTSMFSGHSGTGKSTLINKIEPSLELKTAKISDQHQQGLHTTTFAEMYDLDFNARIIDTPGIKGFGMVGMDKEEVGNYFPEFLVLKSNCKFNNCLHLKEPDCAIKNALDEDEIAFSRYKSYLQILEGEDENYRKDIYDEKK